MAAEPSCTDEARVQKRMEDLVGDNDPLVRYQLAFSLGAMQGTKPARALAALAFRDAGDPWMRMAILSSVSACTGEGLSTAAGRIMPDSGRRRMDTPS